ncbi:MAG TPA: PEP-CTERM sorting domain-containing protein [Lacipirellulaceae bacterium]|jgi:hypothetical protein
MNCSIGIHLRRFELIAARGITFLTVAAGLSLTANTVRADTQVYSFETGTSTAPDGFGPNGGGTVSQDTIGATSGAHSLKYTVPAGATFTGALTSTIDTNVINNPPGIDHVLFDLTIAPGDQFTGSFARIGISVFGAVGQSFGLQAQFRGVPAGQEEPHIDGLAPGTYKDMRINLTGATNPFDFETDQTFNQIFGSGENQLIPTGFQFQINKSNDAPVTIYIDNVRVGTTVAGDYNGNGIVDAADYTIWRDTLGSTTDLRANGDNAGASANVIDQADYTFWKSRFGAISGPGSGALSSGAVPEPASAALLLIAAICCWGVKRVRAAR